MGPAWHIFGLSEDGRMGLIWEHIYGSCMAYFWAEWGWPDGFDLGTHIWVLHGIFWAEWGWPDGFDLGTHIWVLHGIFMR